MMCRRAAEAERLQPIRMRLHDRLPHEEWIYTCSKDISILDRRTVTIDRTALIVVDEHYNPSNGPSIEVSEAKLGFAMGCQMRGDRREKLVGIVQGALAPSC